MDARYLQGVQQTNGFDEEQNNNNFEAHFKFIVWKDIWGEETRSKPCCRRMETFLHPALRPQNSVLNWNIRENKCSIRGPISSLNKPALNLAGFKPPDSEVYDKIFGAINSESIRLYFSWHPLENLKIKENISWTVELNAKDLTPTVNDTSLPIITVWDVIDKIRREMYKQSGDSAPSIWDIPTDLRTRVRPRSGEGSSKKEDLWRLIDYFGLEKVEFDGLFLEPCMMDPGYHFRVLFRKVQPTVQNIAKFKLS